MIDYIRISEIVYLIDCFTSLQSSGLTIEHKRPRTEKPAISELEPELSDAAREGSTSPSARQRKKVRRKSIETNNVGKLRRHQHYEEESDTPAIDRSLSRKSSIPGFSAAYK